MILENAGGGGAVAAPIARKILEAYFEGKKKMINNQKLWRKSRPQIKVFDFNALLIALRKADDFFKI